jgi:hypothetical protein
MKCQRVGVAIVCTSARVLVCNCGRPGNRQCDWKFKADGVTQFERGTCSRAICDRCAVSPEAGKDLCQRHVVSYRAWLARRLENPKPIAPAPVSGDLFEGARE